MRSSAYAGGWGPEWSLPMVNVAGLPQVEEETPDSIEVDQPAIDALVSPPKPHPAVPSRCVFEKIGEAYPGPRSGHQRCRLFAEASSLFDGMGAKNRRW